MGEGARESVELSMDGEVPSVPDATSAKEGREVLSPGLDTVGSCTSTRTTT